MSTWVPLGSWVHWVTLGSLWDCAKRIERLSKGVHYFSMLALFCSKGKSHFLSHFALRIHSELQLQSQLKRIVLDKPESE